MTKTLYWIRHGESLSNVSELNYSIIDPNLTSNGIHQCMNLKKYLKTNKIITNIELVIVSPLERTLETCANIIDIDSHNDSIKIISLDEIREHINEPCHKRKNIKEKKKKYPFINFDKITNDVDTMYKKFNGNEPKSNVISRCEWFINWLKKQKEKNILIITHGNFLLPMFIHVLTHTDNKNFFLNCEIRKTVL